jgi:hypothetical protein
VDVVVAMALSETERAARFFRWLRGNAVSYGTLAVLPAEADLETLQINLNVVDDFVLWPVSKEELRYRVAARFSRSNLKELWRYWIAG